MNATAEAPPPVKEQSSEEIIEALQRTVSASRLSLFLQCRLKWFFRYVLKLSKPKTPSLHLGNSVHTVLKSWNKARWLQQPLSLKEVHENYLQAWADTTEGSVNWEPGEEEEDKTTGWRLCDTYIRQGASMALNKPDAVEVSIEADLARHGLPRLIDQRRACLHSFNTRTDQALDLTGGLGRATCETANLARHHGKSTPLLSSAGSFNSRIQGKDVGLECDAVDHTDDVGDAVRTFVDFLHGPNHVAHHCSPLHGNR